MCILQKSRDTYALVLLKKVEQQELKCAVRTRARIERLGQQVRKLLKSLLARHNARVILFCALFSGGYVSSYPDAA